MSVPYSVCIIIDCVLSIIPRREIDRLSVVSSNQNTQNKNLLQQLEISQSKVDQLRKAMALLANERVALSTEVVCNLCKALSHYLTTYIYLCNCSPHTYIYAIAHHIHTYIYAIYCRTSKESPTSK
jgi:hypothetical protein